MKTITFVGLYNELNFGDPVIARCTEWLFTDGLPDVEVRRIALDQPDVELRRTWRFKLRRRLSKWSGRDCHQWHAFWLYRHAADWFQSRIAGSDLVVVVGGALINYRYLMFGVETAALCTACQKAGVPLVINGVGVEAYDGANPVCRLMSDALQSPALKHISTRDNLEQLRSHYLGPSATATTERVADPAVWAAEAYATRKAADAQLIGIGTGRDRLFSDNGIPIDGVRLLQLYTDLVQQLTAQGHPVQLFTNGLPADNLMARRVQETLRQKGVAVSLHIPQTPAELVSLIASYRAIVATRMHSCIIAYSLDIPAVALTWNEKFHFFGQAIGYPERFVAPDHLQTVHITARLADALHQGYDPARRQAFRDTARNSIRQLRCQWAGE